jgi:RNA polymerase sigma factor (sigma-70 family)
MAHATEELVRLTRACACGDPQARRRFQDEYGELIYTFPLKCYRTPLEEAGDFYVYVFEQDRIFTRLGTFAGRNHIQLRTFLSYYVLKHLFLEWQRTRKELQTISLQTPLGGNDDDRVMEDILADSAMSDPAELNSSEEPTAAAIWQMLSPEERLYLRLLTLLEWDLSPGDIRQLARLSGRSLRDTLALLAEVQERLNRKDTKLSQLRDGLDSVWGWILLRQKELHRIEEKLLLLPAQGRTPERDKLRKQKQALEQALGKRARQQERLIAAIRAYKLTTPYKDIARLLNLSVGAVGARIFRLRERLLREFAESRSSSTIFGTVASSFLKPMPRIPLPTSAVVEERDDRRQGQSRQAGISPMG